jgi:hypothetical protein
MFCIGLASFGVLAWALRKGIALDRALDPGDIVFMSVFAIFGSFCVFMAWHLFRSPSTLEGFPEQGAPAPPRRRVTLSNACSTAGVILLVLSALLPEHWYPVVPLFVGIALLAVSHVLTPCEERLEKLRKARASVQL